MYLNKSTGAERVIQEVVGHISVMVNEEREWKIGLTLSTYSASIFSLLQLCWSPRRFDLCLWISSHLTRCQC